MKTSLLLLLCLLTSSCATYRGEKELVRQEVYAVRDSLQVGRFDLADEHSEQLVRLVPPPKTIIPIASIK